MELASGASGVGMAGEGRWGALCPALWPWVERDGGGEAGHCTEVAVWVLQVIRVTMPAWVSLKCTKSSVCCP